MAARSKKAATSEKALLEEKIKLLSEQNEQLKKEVEDKRERPDDYKIDLDDYIEVMSMVPNTLTLSTEGGGKGKNFTFRSFGEVKRILYNDLASIFEYNHTFLEKGYFYILDKRVIRKHGLDDIYDKLLDKQNIEDIITNNPKNAVKLYESANPYQREVIDTMLVERIKDEEHYNLDRNIIAQISKISGRNLFEIAEEAKRLESTPA